MSWVIDVTKQFISFVKNELEGLLVYLVDS